MVEYSKDEIIRALVFNGICDLEDNDEIIIKKIQKAANDLKQAKLALRLAGDIANNLGFTELSKTSKG